MRLIIFILLLCPIFGIGQKTNAFIKLTDARSQEIKGEAVLKGFEKWIDATSLNSGGKNNTQLSFTMTINGASAALKKALANGESLVSGQVTVLSPNQSAGSPVILYTIKMEKIAVTTCYEAMGCNNIINTTVTLQATRIGWTYYQTGKGNGSASISNKYGWDAEKNADWTNF